MEWVRAASAACSARAVSRSTAAMASGESGASVAPAAVAPPPAGAQLGELLAQVADERARLVGALVLVLDRALERLQLGVRVREVAGEHAVLLDALAGERLELRAHALELGAQALLLLGLGSRLGELGRQALVALGDLAQLLVALGGGL